MGTRDNTNLKRRSRGAMADARLPKRRKPHDAARPESSNPPKAAALPPKTVALSAFHESTLAELRPKYDVVVASVISSTKIRARVDWVLGHLRQNNTHSGGEGPTNTAPLVLLHARPAEVCKMITVSEKVKGVLAGEGYTVYQYNHLFELPPKTLEPTVVEETVLKEADRDSGEGDESDDGFEKLEIFDRAANPKVEARPVRSMGIFLAGVPVPELKVKGGLTLQTAGKPPDRG